MFEFFTPEYNVGCKTTCRLMLRCGSADRFRFLNCFWFTVRNAISFVWLACLSVATPCDNDCFFNARTSNNLSEPRGYCVAGSCICYDGFHGPNCENGKLGQVRCCIIKSSSHTYRSRVSFLSFTVSCFKCGNYQTFSKSRAIVLRVSLNWCPVCSNPTIASPAIGSGT